MTNFKKIFVLIVLAVALASIPGLYAKATVVQGCPDVNADGRINILDLIVVRNALYTSADTSNWIESRDINGDNLVDINDLYLLRDNLGLAEADNAAMDLNSDGRINILDLILVRNALGSMNPDASNNQWDSRKDPTGDNKVTMDDLYYIRNYLNQKPADLSICQAPTQSQPQSEPAPRAAQIQPESQPQGNSPASAPASVLVPDEKPVAKMTVIQELQAKIALIQQTLVNLLTQYVQVLRGQVIR